MPTEIYSSKDISPGEIYEDTFFHPCICLEINDFEIVGISLIDGSYPRTIDIPNSFPRKLTLEEAWKWKLEGPQDLEELAIEFKEDQKWWIKK